MDTHERACVECTCGKHTTKDASRLSKSRVRVWTYVASRCFSPLHIKQSSMFNPLWLPRTYLILIPDAPRVAGLLKERPRRVPAHALLSAIVDIKRWLQQRVVPIAQLRDLPPISAHTSTCTWLTSYASGRLSAMLSRTLTG